MLEATRIGCPYCGEEFETMFSNVDVLILEKTGHAPFISKPEICAEKIKNFINE